MEKKLNDFIIEIIKLILRTIEKKKCCIKVHGLEPKLENGQSPTCGSVAPSIFHQTITLSTICFVHFPSQPLLHKTSIDYPLLLLPRNFSHGCPHSVLCNPLSGLLADSAPHPSFTFTQFNTSPSPLTSFISYS